jgi:hypothetical protein
MRLIRERHSLEKMLCLRRRPLMNKIVREHYPVSKLPKDLRPSDNPNARVTVTIETEELSATTPTRRRPVAGYVGGSENVHGDPDAVIDHIRSLREDR